jgi:hypothetical protein
MGGFYNTKHFFQRCNKLELIVVRILPSSNKSVSVANTQNLVSFFKLTSNVDLAPTKFL